jgi:hypothetical protein
LASVADQRLLGNVSGSAAAPTALTGTQTTALLDAVVGDSGSGGTKGLVPAPAAGDAAANKYLKADGTWAAAPTAPVTSVHGRTGVVASANGDYTASQVTNVAAGNIAATTVQAALNELDTEKQAAITGAASTITGSDLTASRAVVSDGSGKVAVSAVTSTELGYVSGVTSAIQTQLDAKQASITGGATTIVSSDLTASRAVVSDVNGKVAASAVTSTELGYVSGVTSAIQTQLDAKQATVTGAATTITGSDLTASRAVVSDGSGKVAASAVTSTELGYVSGVTSAIQTQLNAKQATVTGAATTITGTDLAASRAVVSDGSGKVAVSAVTSTELGYVAGVTSAIQTQLDAKQASNADLSAVAGLSTTGVVVRTGSGTATTRSVAAGTGVAVTNGDGVSGNPTVALASVADQRLLGNVSGSAAAPTALTGTQTTALLDVVAGDTGSGGTKGLVPAPAAGDAAANKYLKADGTWAAAPTAPVTSVHGRTGVVASANGDYTASQVTNVAAGNIAATTVQAALNELDTEKQAAITGAATTITGSDLTASRAVVSDVNGKVAVSNVTATELGYVSGVTSAIQTQMDAKATDASVVHLAGSETISGAKTFSAATDISNATASSSPNTGALRVTGGVGVGGALWAGGGLNLSTNTNVTLGDTTAGAGTGRFYSYNTATNSANAEYLDLKWSGNTAYLMTHYLASGASRGLVIGRAINNGDATNLGATLTFSASAAEAIALDRSGNNNVSSSAIVKIGTPSGSLAASTAVTQYGLTVTPAINQSNTAGYTAFLVNATETATGSGTKRLLDLQVGSVSMFSVDNAGNTTIAGSLTMPSQSANTVYAAPDGSAGAPSFRALVAADVPNLDWSKITSGKPTTLAGYGITDAASDSAVVHLAGTETVSGAKTFSAVVNVSNATASTSSTTGSLTVAGGLGVAGSVMAGAGSAGTPAIGFNTSNTTGFFQQAADTVSAAFTGTERLRLASSFFLNPSSGVTNINAAAIGTDVPLTNSSFALNSAPFRSYLTSGTNSTNAAVFGRVDKTSNGNTNIGVYGMSRATTSSNGTAMGLYGDAQYATASNGAGSNAVGIGYYSTSANTNAGKTSYGISGAVTATGASNAAPLVGYDNTVTAAATSDSAIGETITVTHGGTFAGTTLKGLAATVTMSGTASTTATTVRGLDLALTVNQGSTLGYTGILSNVTETATGSGSKRLIDLQVGGASKFSVDNAGNTTMSGSLNMPSQSANTVFAAPNGSAGAPTFRTLVAADVPNLDWSKITSGTPTTLAGYGITDAASDAAVVHLAQTETVSGAKTFSAVTSVSNATASSSTTTGALTVAGGVGIAGDLYAGNLLHRSTASGLTASTTQTQGQQPLTKEINQISVCANANDTVTLPAAVSGERITVINNGANTLQIYPASGDAINGGAANAASTLASGTSTVFHSYDGANWISFSNATGLGGTIADTQVAYGSGTSIAGSANMVFDGTKLTLAAGTGTTLAVSSTEASTTTTSGALTVAGGLGVAGAITTGSGVDIKAGSGGNGFRLYDSTLLKYTLSMPGNDFRITHASLGQVFGVNEAGTYFLGAGGTMTGRTTTLNGTVGIPNATATSDKLTGALVVTGGIASGGAIIGNTLGLSHTTGPSRLTLSSDASRSYISAIGGQILTLSGDNGSAPHVEVASGSVMKVSNTTASTSTGTGGLIVAGGVGIAGDIFTGNLLHRSTASGITASTTQTQGQQPLTKEINQISVCANANDAVTLPAAVAGERITVINSGANTLRIYPASGDAINGGAVDAPTTLATGTSAVFHSYNGTNWVVFSNASGLGGTIADTQVAYGSGSNIAGSSNMVFDGSKLTLAAGSGTTLAVGSTQTSTTTTSGALTVAGGVGVGGNLYAGGNVHLATASGSSIFALYGSISDAMTLGSSTAISYSPSNISYPSTQAPTVYKLAVTEANSTSGTGRGGVFSYVAHSSDGEQQATYGGVFYARRTGSNTDGAGNSNEDPAIGVYARSYRTSAAGTLTGMSAALYGSAFGGSTSYGIYATASGATTTNYAGYFASGLVAVADTTASSSTTNGALTVAGGLGVAGTVNAASVAATTSVQLPTEAAAPTVAAGMIRYNTSGYCEFYSGSAWVPMNSYAP